MKKKFLFIIWILNFISLFSQENYNGGNGTVLTIENIDNIKWTYRRHEQILRPDFDIDILEQPNGKELFIIKKNENMNIFLLALEENILNKNMKCWLKIKNDNGNEGWVYYGERDPYANGILSVIETMEIGNKKWTILKTDEQGLYAVDRLNIRDNPGLINTTVIYQFRFTGKKWSFEYYNELSVVIIAMTEENETIDDPNLNRWNKTSPWIKIKNKQGIEGWVFGGYLEQGERGGHKIYTPGNRILMNYTYP